MLYFTGLDIITHFKLKINKTLKFIKYLLFYLFITYHIIFFLNLVY